MNNSKNNDGISDERLEEIRKSLFVDLRKTLLKDINDKIKGSVSDYTPVPVSSVCTMAGVKFITFLKSFCKA